MDGYTKIIAHIGYPTGSFKAPMIYNPYFESIGVNAAVVPMGVKAEDFASAFPLIFRMSTTHGALITMPHKFAVMDMLDVISPAAEICGACNAVKRNSDGKLVGDMFDGEGFARGLERKGQAIRGRTALVAGSGGVGSAIAAALAARGLEALRLFDVNPDAADDLAERLNRHYPKLKVETGSRDPAGRDIVINATPLGMNAGDPMPVDVERISPETFVGEVV
ncbi:MAG: shikimate dehydrogenase family protein, partial [Beijerinckiaceae bacterium]